MKNHNHLKDKKNTKVMKDSKKCNFYKQRGKMLNFLFTSESVLQGHPDKIADQISDAILDECLRVDPESKVACETMIGKDVVVLCGEITTKAKLNYREIIKDVLKSIGYDDPKLGFDYNSFKLFTSIHEQSPDIAQGVIEGKGLYEKQGAGDQGMMFGYACNETEEYMPLPITLAHKICTKLQDLRLNKVLKYLRPDGKCQVTVEYSKDHIPVRTHTVVISTQHSEDVKYITIVKDMKKIVQEIIPKNLFDDNILYFINPTGRFVLGGPVADCGLTGRKIIVDTYGGMGKHGGGCFSGKDPSKVDRSAAYAARYVAKNIVAANLATRCEVQIAYAIGVAHPISIKVDTFGTSSIDEEIITCVIPEIFDLSPKGIINMLDMKKTHLPPHFLRRSFWPQQSF